MDIVRALGKLHETKMTEILTKYARALRDVAVLREPRVRGGLGELQSDHRDRAH